MNRWAIVGRPCGTALPRCRSTHSGKTLKCAPTAGTAWRPLFTEIRITAYSGIPLASHQRAVFPKMNPNPPVPATHAKRSNPQTETLVEFVEDAVIVSGRDGKILDWNAGAGRIFGWTPGEALRMAVSELQ